MKTEKNTAQNTETIEEFDPELLYAEDANGNKIPDSQIVARATEVQTLTFKAAGAIHKVKVRFDQLGYLTRRAPSKIALRILDEHGVASLDDETLKESAELTEKAEAANEEIEASLEYLTARAAIVCEVVVRDGQGRALVSVPHWRENLTPEVVATDKVFGRPFINTVQKAVNDFFGS